jgi:type IV secretory pathway TraG/TraD family ATPase VirD4
MRKLWSASNIAVYGGGVKEPEFLGELSQMIGDYDKHTYATSVGRGSRSTSHQMHRERTLDIADLGALPRGRAIVFASGAPATLIETVPWMKGPKAAEVIASISAHDPILRNRTTPSVPVELADPVAASNGSNPWLAGPLPKDLP